jgi:ketosteroid isomerase-like protein
METPVERMSRIETRLALEEINNAFCYYLDHNDVDNLAELFCEDAVYSHGARISQGREQIRRLFQTRLQGGMRTTRHLQTGLMLQLNAADHATGTSVCLTFAADEAPPVRHAAPYLVADFTDQYRLCADGRWRIAKRHIERIFAAPENTAPVGMVAGAITQSERPR